MAFALASSAFSDGETIPTRYTCDGDDVPPPLTWSDAPAGTHGFALIMDDPDAPNGTFTHWLLFDIPARTTELPGEAASKTLRNDFGRSGYGGPCPPRGHGQHRYVFTLYAVGVPSLELQGESREDLGKALRTHTVATARLTGRYDRVEMQE